MTTSCRPSDYPPYEKEGRNKPSKQTTSHNTQVRGYMNKLFFTAFSAMVLRPKRR